MDSNTIVVYSLVPVVISLVLPVALTIWWGRREDVGIKQFAVGALGFVISQIVLRVPLLALLSSQSWFAAFADNNKILYFGLIGLSAGIFETLARWVGLKYFLKNQLTVKNGVAYGLGHGGVEAIFLSAGVMFLDFVVLLWIKGGIFLESIAAMPEPLQQMFISVQERVLTLGPSYFLASGLERVLVMAGHVGLTMLVLIAVRNKKPLYFLYALLFHTVVDSVFPLLYASGWNIWFIETLLMVKATFALYLVSKLSREDAPPLPVTA